MDWFNLRDFLGSDSDEFTHSFEARIEPSQGVNLEYEELRDELRGTVETVADEQYDLGQAEINITEYQVDQESDDDDKKLEIQVSDIFELNAEYTSQERYFQNGSDEVRGQFGGGKPVFVENMSLEVNANNFGPIDIISEKIKQTNYEVNNIVYTPE